MATTSTKSKHRRFVDTMRPADSQAGIIANVSNTDFLQAISLLLQRDRRRDAERAGKSGKELPAVIGNRQALLNLPLSAYKQYEKQVEHGFVQAAKFLHMQHIYRIFDLPYQSQIVPLKRSRGHRRGMGAWGLTVPSWFDGIGMACLVNYMVRRLSLASPAILWRCRNGYRVGWNLPQ